VAAAAAETVIQRVNHRHRVTVKMAGLAAVAAIPQAVRQRAPAVPLRRAIAVAQRGMGMRVVMGIPMAQQTPQAGAVAVRVVRARRHLFNLTQRVAMGVLRIQVL
jgi:hypothetical protein